MNLMPAQRSDVQPTPYDGASPVPPSGLAQMPLHTPVLPTGDAFMRAGHWGSRKRPAAEMYSPSEAKLLAVQRRLLEEMLRADAAEVSGTDQEDQDRSKKDYDSSDDEDILTIGSSSEGGGKSSVPSKKPRRKKQKVATELCVEMVPGGHHELRMRRKPKSRKASTARKRRTSKQGAKIDVQGSKVTKRKAPAADPIRETAVPGCTTVATPHPSGSHPISTSNCTDENVSNVYPLELQSSMDASNDFSNVHPMGLHDGFATSMPTGTETGSQFSFAPPVEVPKSPIHPLGWSGGDHESNDEFRDRLLAAHFQFGAGIVEEEDGNR